jgi:SOS-response transcriptional repressor LexA
MIPPTNDPPVAAALAVGSVQIPVDTADVFAVPDLTGLMAFVVSGDCMALAGINDRDIVFADPRVACHEDVVVAVVDGRSVLKRYVLDNGVALLRAADPKVPDLVPQQELVVRGVVVGLMRRFD